MLFAVYRQNISTFHADFEPNKHSFTIGIQLLTRNPEIVILQTASHNFLFPTCRLHRTVLPVAVYNMHGLLNGFPFICASAMISMIV